MAVSTASSFTNATPKYTWRIGKAAEKERESDSKRERERDREGEELMVYVLAIKKDDFSYVQSNILTEDSETGIQAHKGRLERWSIV